MTPFTVVESISIEKVKLVSIFAKDVSKSNISPSAFKSIFISIIPLSYLADPQDKDLLSKHSTTLTVFSDFWQL